MRNWLWSIPPSNYAICVERGTFAVRTAGRRSAERVQTGDAIFAYIPGPRVIAGLFRASEGYHFSEQLIWPDGVYPHRVNVAPEVLLPVESGVHLDSFKTRLEVGDAYPNFGLVIQKVVHEISQSDAEILRELVREQARAAGFPEPAPAPPVHASELPPTPVPPTTTSSSPGSVGPTEQSLLQDLHRANQRIGILLRKVRDLEELLALAGPNLEDYLRLAHSSQGPAFEEATRKCFVALGFRLDPDYQGQPGQVDFVAVAPFYLFGECQASGGQNVSVTIVDKLLRHRRRYIAEKRIVAPTGDCRVVISEFATEHLAQDAVTEEVAIIRPSQLAGLLKLKREYPGAVHPFNLRPVFQHPGDITPKVAAFIDATREQIERRVGIIEVLKNDRFARAAVITGRDPGWIQARVEIELETHISLSEVEDILRELTSPLVGCVGMEEGDRGRVRFYYIRDYDFQVVSVGPREEIVSLD